MSAHALGSHALAGQDVAALTNFSARRKMPEGVDDEGSGGGFDAALAQSGNETPPQPPPTASAFGLAPRSVKTADAAAAAAEAAGPRGSGFWTELPALAGAKAAGGQLAASDDVAQKAAIAPTTPAKSPPLDTFAKFLASSAAADAPPERTQMRENSLAEPTEPRGSTPLLSQKVEPVPAASAVASLRPAKTSTASKKTSAESEGEAAPAVTSAASAKATEPAEPSAATCIAASPPPPVRAAASRSDGAASDVPTGSATERESVARIGAALASTNWPASAPGVSEESSDDPEIHLAGPPAKTAVHVVAQKTWLQPVSHVLIPGLNCDRAAAESPHAAAMGAEAGAPPPSQTPAAMSPAPASLPDLGETVIDPSEESSSAPTAAAAPENASAIPHAAAPRRDLEITLAPKDLGGLAVRMKSAGDRLEIAFVAERGETARMISDKSAALQSQLQGAGLGLGGIEIAAASRSESDAAGWTPSNGGASADGAEADPRENSQTAPQGQEFAGRNRQDKGHDGNQRTSEPRVPGGGAGGLYL
ncbi:flagellar hook-length control protein FliK [Rhodoblastus sp.]|uniref:flagellar hook-length control protein FliK n=1 Tax=Rhodoblastus sp. TaxID=1962975 RepID=UPI003F9BA54B